MVFHSDMKLYDEVPEGDLNVLAADSAGKTAVGIISVVWIAWIIVSMLVSW